MHWDKPLYHTSNFQFSNRHVDWQQDASFSIRVSVDKRSVGPDSTRNPLDWSLSIWLDNILPLWHWRDHRIWFLIGRARLQCYGRSEDDEKETECLQFDSKSWHSCPSSALFCVDFPKPTPSLRPMPPLWCRSKLLALRVTLCSIRLLKWWEKTGIARSWTNLPLYRPTASAPLSPFSLYSHKISDSVSIS